MHYTTSTLAERTREEGGHAANALRKQTSKIAARPTIQFKMLQAGDVFASGLTPTTAKAE